jgi:hypothetical protein
MTDSRVTSDLGPCQAPFPDPIPRILPFGSVNYMAGASGVGKTIVMADWLARMRDGRPVCGHQTNKPTGFYYLAADRDWSTYARAFEHAGFPEIERYVLTEDREFKPKMWKRTDAFQFLDRCLQRLSPIPGSFTVLDPAVPLFVQGKPNDAWDVAISSHYFRQVAREYQTTLVCMANVVKQKSEEGYVRPQDRIAGSGAFVAYSDTQIYLSRDEDGILTLGWTPRLHAAEEFSFYFNQTSHLFEPHAASTTTIGLPPHLMAVLDLIPHPPATITSPDLVRLVVEKRKVKRAMAFRNIQHLIERGTIDRDELGIIKRNDLTAKPAPVEEEAPPPPEEEGRR